MGLCFGSKRLCFFVQQPQDVLWDSWAPEAIPQHPTDSINACVTEVLS